MGYFMPQFADWITPATPDESLSIITKLALLHCRKGGKQGERIASSITSGDFLSVCNTDFSYETSSTWELRNSRQAVAYFSKYKGIKLPGVDPRAAAVAKFFEAEAACQVTNDIFQKRAQGSFFLGPWAESIIYRAQSKIARVLGECPSFSDLKPRFGPGATTLTKKRNASVVEKLQAGISCSEDLLPYASRVLEEMPHLTDLHSQGYYSRLCDKEECTRVPVSITNDVVDFVAKNAKTHRSITITGSLNTLVQLAYGDYMTDRLRAFGIDLKDQSINQSLAFQGSMSGEYATLDLRSASDTISTELVFSLLPIDWALALDSCRSSRVTLDGQTIRLEKFSSMGCGFTFPLQSLIFWALASSAADDGFASVYGDDIVVRGPYVQDAIRILEICGFSINMEKSYWTGPFRESCGGDYIRGIDIRPHYQKELVNAEGLFLLHNFYVRRDDDEMASEVLNLIPEHLRLYGPDGFGDGHLLGDWTPRRKKRHVDHGYGGVVFDTYSREARRDKRALRPGDRVLPTYSIYTRSGSDGCLAGSVGPQGSHNYASYLRIKGRGYGVDLAPLETPERVSQVDGTHIKCVSLPGTDGYRRTSIYTLDW